MNVHLLDSFSPIYLNALREDVLPFWEQHSPDPEYGGYFTCLDRDGSVYDTEKFMWMQWRIVWMVSELYCTLEKRPEWLALAESGYRFLTQHGRDDQGRYYFALNRQGVPTMAPYSVYSECFAAMGCAAYYRASGDPEAREEAGRAYQNYLGRQQRPKGEWTKELQGRAPMQTLGFHMGNANLLTVLSDCLGEPPDESVIREAVETVLNTFWSPEHKLLFENVRMDGHPDLESMGGRHLIPGHAIETMWMIMESAQRVGRKDWIDRAADIILAELDFAWDAEEGGLYYLMDALHKPHVELSWNMKLWWVHNEALIATWLAYRLTGRDTFATWFKRLHEWTWAHFPDREHGEWFGYLDRYGTPTHTLKGGKWKTLFHLPRMLLTIGLGHY